MDEESAEHDLSGLEAPSLARLVQKAQRRAKWQRQRRGPVASTSKAAKQPSAASFYVPRLPGQPLDLELSPMYSGHLPASYSIQNTVDPEVLDNDAHLFFLLVKAKHVADKAKLVIWFNGGEGGEVWTIRVGRPPVLITAMNDIGPGCSSFDGALLEIGPAFVQGTGKNATLVRPSVQICRHAS